jgi:hypothetical protein
VKPLPTPAPTPCNSNTPGEQAPTLLPPQDIAQEEPGRDDQAPSPLDSHHVSREGEFDYDDPADQLESVSRGHHDDSSPAAQQELEQGSRPAKYTYVEVADDCGSEQSSGPQHSTNRDAWPPADHGDDLRDQDARPNSQSSEQAATPLIQYESDTTQDKPRKRQHNFEGSRDSKRPHIEAADATEVELGSRSLQCSKPFELRPGPNQNERHDQQPEISEASQDGRLSIAAVPLPALPQTVVTSRRPSSEPSSAVDLPEGGSDRFSKLSVALRAKLHMIGDTVTRATIGDYVNYTATPPPSADDCADASEGDPGPDTISALDRRHKVLKDRIIRDETAEKTVKYLGVAIRISKRVALAELIGSYIEERDARTAMPKKRRRRELPRLSPKDRFTDLLFPETKQTEEEDGERKDARKKAKAKLSYWITLGEPLAGMAQRFGYGILAHLPAKLTDKE